MSQKSSLTQSAHSVRQVLTGYTLGLATEYPLWDGAALLAQNPIALLSLILAIAVMFTLGVVYDRPG